MKISEVAALTNTSTKTLRFYENSGLLPPPARTASGYRNYGPEIVDRLRFIHRGQAAGLALQHYRKYAKSWPSTTAARRRAHTSANY